VGIHIQSGARLVSLQEEEGEVAMNKQLVLQILLLSCILFLCCCAAPQKQGEQKTSDPESNKSEEKQKASIAELKRLYETAKSEYERRAVCLRAIDEGAVHHGASVSTIDEIFGTHFASNLPTRKEAHRQESIDFANPVSVTDKSSSAANVGWFMSVVYNYKGEIENYYLTNFHK
jgi:hypothetical protein